MAYKLAPKEVARAPPVDFISDNSIPHDVGDIEIEMEFPLGDELPPPDFTDVDIEREGPQLGEVPLTEEVPPPDVNDIDTEREGPPRSEDPRSPSNRS
ncbi:uncharacterized protein A4U43_C01F15230 [Asparagus officinalis]|uniref:Uncharacterized protein n=1 Tax=Asparagus officinalis TaxID=4686 RepID=A0A5P1FPR3_ASPOF|nr:uncharacterized protein A4U43_C01F15230 [Asparagus officinalis]